jgi:4-amino-4-deoxy-L-arabinose transferase-like glycosyltransferase
VTAPVARLRAVAERSAGVGGWARPQRRRAGALWLVGPLGVYVLLRLPSFFEPHWYTDEAGYVTTARSLLQGKVLYSQIWNNKPPLHLWTVAADIALLGQSEAAFHAVTMVSGLLTLAAIAYAGRRLLGRGRSGLALLIAALLLGSPVLDAELLLPESLLIAPITWAGALVVTRVARPDRSSPPLWPAAAGALAALAVGFQQTALAETVAFAVVLVLIVPEGVSRLRRLAAYLAAFLGVTALWLIPAVITAGAGTVGFALAGFYLAFTRSEYPHDGSGVLLVLLLPLVVLVLALVSAWHCRRDRDPAAALWLWTIAALLVPAVARQPYAHYLTASVAPGALAVCSLRPGWRPVGRPLAAAPTRPVMRGAAQLGLLAATVLAVWGASVTGLDWVFPPGGPDHTLAYYYGGAVSVATRGQPLAAWQDGFDYRVPEDAQVAAWLRANGLQGSTAVVWSADAWLYDEGHLQLLLPTPPIYNDEVLLGSDTQLGHDVGSLAPQIVITEGVARLQWPSINGVLSSAYQAVEQSGDEIVWVRDDLVTSLAPRSAGQP